MRRSYDYPSLFGRTGAAHRYLYERHGRRQATAHAAMPNGEFGAFLCAAIAFTFALSFGITWSIMHRAAADVAVTATEEGYPRIDWFVWQETNPDIVGWVSVEGSAINQPIVQAPVDAPQFYLDHDVYRSYNLCGCPYLDAECEALGFSGWNAVVSGHNLGYGDEALFGDFARFENEAYAQDHRLIRLQTPTWKKTLTVQAVEVIAGGTATKRISFDDGTDFSRWYEERVADATVTLGDGSVPNSTVFQFCTCGNSETAEQRVIVFAAEAPV